MLGEDQQSTQGGRQFPHQTSVIHINTSAESRAPLILLARPSFWWNMMFRNTHTKIWPRFSWYFLPWVPAVGCDLRKTKARVYGFRVLVTSRPTSNILEAGHIFLYQRLRSVTRSSGNFPATCVTNHVFQQIPHPADSENPAAHRRLIPRVEEDGSRCILCGFEAAAAGVAPPPGDFAVSRWLKKAREGGRLVCLKECHHLSYPFHKKRGSVVYNHIVLKKFTASRHMHYIILRYLYDSMKLKKIKKDPQESASCSTHVHVLLNVPHIIAFSNTNHNNTIHIYRFII